MSETRLKRLLDILIRQKDYLSSAEMAKQFDVSTKTIRTELKKFNEILSKHGAKIVSKSNAGFKLEIYCKCKFDSFLENQWKEYAFEKKDYNDPKFRRKYLIKELILNNNYMSFDELTEMLMISESTLSGDLKLIKSVVRNNNLDLEVSEKKGAIIKGDEIAKRSCLVDIYQDSFVENEEMYRIIEKIVQTYISEYCYKINSLVYKTLIIHMYIMVNRLLKIEKTVYGQHRESVVDDRVEIKISKKLLQKFKEEFGINYNNQEVYYVAEKLIASHQSDDFDNQKISIEVDKLVLEMLKEVKDTTNYDFISDLDLRVSLGLHVAQLIERLCFKVTMKNPLLREIKKKVLAYNLAVISVNPIKRKYSSFISDDEIGYIAFYFAGAIERIHRLANQKRIAIICGSGRATSQMMKEKFLSEFTSYCGSLTILDKKAIETEDLNLYDLIVSSIPINKATNTPIIEVSPFMNESDISLIQSTVKTETSNIKCYFDSNLFFTNYKAIDKDDFIKSITERIVLTKGISKDLLDEIYEREKIVPTEYDNLVALPHPLHPLSDETFVTVAILEKPIRWFKKDVQLVILMNIGKNQGSEIQKFYSILSKALYGGNKVKKLILSKSLDEFINILEK